MMLCDTGEMRKLKPEVSREKPRVYIIRDGCRACLSDAYSYALSVRNLKSKV